MHIIRVHRERLGGWCTLISGSRIHLVSRFRRRTAFDVESAAVDRNCGGTWQRECFDLEFSFTKPDDDVPFAIAELGTILLVVIDHLVHVVAGEVTKTERFTTFEFVITCKRAFNLEFR